MLLLLVFLYVYFLNIYLFIVSCLFYFTDLLSMFICTLLIVDDFLFLMICVDAFLYVVCFVFHYYVISLYLCCCFLFLYFFFVFFLGGDKDCRIFLLMILGCLVFMIWFWGVCFMMFECVLFVILGCCFDVLLMIRWYFF